MRVDMTEKNTNDWKSRRIAVGITQLELAIRSGVSLGTISSIERGSTRPSRLSRKALDIALGGDGMPADLWDELLHDSMRGIIQELDPDEVPSFYRLD